MAKNYPFWLIEKVIKKSIFVPEDSDPDITEKKRRKRRKPRKKNRKKK